MKKKILIILTLLLISKSAYCADMDAESALRFNEYYNNGVTLFKAGKYSTAILEFKKVLRVKPYDVTVKNALVSSYLARGDFYANKSSEPKKAINDFKSALFYLKYWGGADAPSPDASLVSNTLNNLQFLENKTIGTQNAAQKFENAKTLRTIGELQASCYDFIQLFSNATYAKNALENAGDIYKTLNNQLEAISCYRKVLKLDEKNAGVHFKYALILDDINNTDAAAEEYNLALKYGEKNLELLDNLENLWLSRVVENPNDAQAYINLGTIFQKKGDFVNAKTQYLKAQSLDPSDKTIAYNLASLYLAQNNYAGAITIYDQILAKSPSDIDVLIYKATAQEKTGNFKGAISTYKTIEAIAPDSEDGIDAKRQIARIVSKNYTGADLLSYLELEANSNPTDFNAQYDCAYALHKAGSFDSAIPYYKNALNINPKYTEGYINLAQLYINKNDYQNAQGVLNWGLNMLPNNPKLVEQKNNIVKAQAGDLYQSATKYWEAKNYNLALQNYLKIPIQTPEVLSAIAGCYSELNNHKQALEYYKKILEKSPNNLDALEGAAGEYLDLNDEVQSKVYLNKILTIDPQNANAKQALLAFKEGESAKEFDNAIALYEKKDYVNAMNAFNKIATQDPQNAYAFYYKALIFDDQKKLMEAILNYKKAVALDPKFSLAFYGLAIALDAKENYPEAVINYDKYLLLKTQEGAKPDDYTNYVKSRSTELKAYLKK